MGKPIANWTFQPTWRRSDGLSTAMSTPALSTTGAAITLACRNRWAASSQLSPLSQKKKKEWTITSTTTTTRTKSTNEHGSYDKRWNKYLYWYDIKPGRWKEGNDVYLLRIFDRRFVGCIYAPFMKLTSTGTMKINQANPTHRKRACKHTRPDQTRPSSNKLIMYEYEYACW